MLDRQKLEVILARRFRGAPLNEVAAAANAIMGLDDEWQEVGDETQEPGHTSFLPQCGEICYLAHEVENGAEFRLLRRREAEARHR